MAAIRERKKADGSIVFHVQVRQTGFPARTGSFPTRRLAERWAKTIEAEMIEGRHFRSSESRRRTVADAITRYTDEELPKKRDGNMHRACLPWWREKIGELKLAVLPLRCSANIAASWLEKPIRAPSRARNARC